MHNDNSRKKKALSVAAVILVALAGLAAALMFASSAYSAEPDNGTATPSMAVSDIVGDKVGALAARAGADELDSEPAVADGNAGEAETGEVDAEWDDDGYWLDEEATWYAEAHDPETGEPIKEIPCVHDIWGELPRLIGSAVRRGFSIRGS